ncbi:hypothetical protein K492DRAFT_171779 [Lichtheimia hyalospora FSU 10163]|nr:hypothetical protein K492DRAFT_171779 [Lichtheimia hyalospora FSU 10163]
MASYEADCEDLSGDESWETDNSFLSNRPTPYAFNDAFHVAGTVATPVLPPTTTPMHTIDELEPADDPSAYSDGSEYSLDYEYLGPRNPNYRPRDDADSDASELSDADLNMQEADNDETTVTTATAATTATTAGFDMWDEDPYSTNDYTWESNDMRLTWFIKARKTQLAQLDAMAPWHRTSFWRKEKGWPRQLPSSCSTTNHDQSANALCLVLGNYGLSEQLYAIYRNRILECGRPTVMDTRRQQHQHQHPFNHRGAIGGGSLMGEQRSKQDPLTWIDSDQRSSSSSVRIQGSAMMDGKSNNNNTSSSSSSSSNSGSHQQYPTTTITNQHEGGSDDNSNSGTSSNGSKFCETHLSVSLRRSSTSDHPNYNHMLSSSSSCGDSNNNHDHANMGIISKFVPFTKYIRRADFPPVFRQDSYMALEFEPLCLAQKYGYMAIGGLEGEFELYCCHDQEHPPRKIWGTKFKSKNNVQLMTNSVQIVRLSRLDQPNVYDHMLIVCMNEAGVLLYRLPPHHDCLEQQHHHQQVVQLYTHLRSFDNVPINDAKISFDQRRMVCVGDDRYVFLFDLVHDTTTGSVVFTNQRKLVVPVHRLQGGGGAGNDPAGEMPYSSQYVSWSQSLRHFAHTSDTHNHVLVWRAETQQVLYSIDAAGYTYAIAFHPRLEGVLAFTNRYGYLHTINLEEAILATTSSIHQHHNQQVVNILDLDHNNTQPILAFSNNDTNEQGECLAAHQEITMIAFRGERDRRLRILAKINGIQWSRDGKYLYVATKKRVLAYEFLMTSRSVSSLVELTGDKVREIFERFDSATREQDNNKQRINNMTSRKRKRMDKKNISSRPSKDPKIRATAWFTKWSLVPPHLRHTVLKESNLASHW